MPGFGSAIVCLRTCLLANALLAVIKLFAGIVGNSQALVADAINSLLDVVSSAVAWIGHRISLRPPDKGHPQGHGNADVLAALFIGVIILGTGVFVVEGAWSALTGEPPEQPTLLPVFVAGGAIIFKGILYRYTAKVARATRSPSVQASAADHKSDVLATSGALVGVLAAWAGWPLLDPIAALWVAAMIIYHAVRILYDNIHILMSGQPVAGRLEPVMNTLKDVSAVKGLHRTRARTLGSKIIVYAEILVDGELSVHAGHEVAKLARRTVLDRHPDVIDLEVHVEPLEQFRVSTGEVDETK